MPDGVGRHGSTWFPEWELAICASIASCTLRIGGAPPEGRTLFALDSARAGCRVHADILKWNENLLAQWLPDDARFAEMIGVFDLPQRFQLMADIVTQRVVCCLA